MTTLLYHHRTLGDGAEGIHIQEMIRAFRDLGHQVVVLSPVGEKTNQASAKRSWGERLRRGLPRAFFECLEIAYNLPATANLLLLARRHRPSFIYERYVTFNAAGAVAARLLGIPLILEVNAPLALERSQQPDETLRFQRLAHFLERWICSHSHRTLVVSTPLRDYLASVGVPAAKLAVVPNGVNLRSFASPPYAGALRERLGFPAEAKVIGFVGVMRPWHGIDMLLDAFAMLDKEASAELRLLLVGDSPIQGELMAQVERLGLTGKVVITGRVRHADIPGHIALFDIAVSPKATFYASPMKIIEYMAMGKAVVAPDMANIRDLIEDGLDGRLFSPGSASSLAAALSGLIADPARTAAIGEAARRKTLERLNWENNARTVLGWIGNGRDPARRQG